MHTKCHLPIYFSNLIFDMIIELKQLLEFDGLVRFTWPMKPISLLILPAKFGIYNRYISTTILTCCPRAQNINYTALLPLMQSPITDRYPRLIDYDGPIDYFCLTRVCMCYLFAMPGRKAFGVQLIYQKS